MVGFYHFYANFHLFLIVLEVLILFFQCQCLLFQLFVLGNQSIVLQLHLYVLLFMPLMAIEQRFCWLNLLALEVVEAKCDFGILVWWVLESRDSLMVYIQLPFENVEEGFSSDLFLTAKVEDDLDDERWVWCFNIELWSVINERFSVGDLAFLDEADGLFLLPNKHISLALLEADVDLP